MINIFKFIWIVITYITQLVLNRALEDNYIALAILPFVGVAN